jgi:hypothetical protein
MPAILSHRYSVRSDCGESDLSAAPDAADIAKRSIHQSRTGRRRATRYAVRERALSGAEAQMIGATVIRLHRGMMDVCLRAHRENLWSIPLRLPKSSGV